LKVFINLTMPETENKIIKTERYSVFAAKSKEDIESALQLRFDVFNVEIARQKPTNNIENLEFDEFDAHCRHLIVIENKTGKTVGTYRLNTIETAEKIEGFYSFSEFCLEDLPSEVLSQSVEIGRACISREHRNTKVLFLLWKGLADFLSANNKRYLFGCTSIFSVNPRIGCEAYKLLLNKGFLHKSLRISPRKNHIIIDEKPINSEKPEIPSLFNMYLKIGAKICGYPTIDPIFKTTDFFVIFDVETLNEKYRKMFFND
jgi:putative hemolysin